MPNVFNVDPDRPIWSAGSLLPPSDPVARRVRVTCAYVETEDFFLGSKHLPDVIAFFFIYFLFILVLYVLKKTNKNVQTSMSAFWRIFRGTRPFVFFFAVLPLGLRRTISTWRLDVFFFPAVGGGGLHTLTVNP